MRLLPLFLALLLPIFLISAGCDRDSTALLEASPNGSQIRGLSATQSRVFDGRDSLQTGFNGPTATKDNFAIVTQFIEVDGGDDVGRIGITDPDALDPSTLLFESRAGNPILAPDGDHVTWGTFSGAKGAIIVKCMRKATHVVVHLSSLIPNGVYSIRNKLFEPGTTDLIGQIGYQEQDQKGASRGSSASPSGQSAFRASARGEGHISGHVRPEALDEIGACMLDDVKAGAYDWRTVAIYQMDGTPGLDEAGTFVEQAGFTFETEQNVEKPIE